MADQLPPWISRTGDAISSGLGAVGSGISSALPYALPAALGAGIGALSGQGTGATVLGGLAGGLAAKGVQSEADQKAAQEKAEMDLKQQQLHLEAQKDDIEIQKGKLSLQNDADKDKYKKESITEEQAKLTGIPVETLRQMYNDKPEDYFQTIGMANWVHKMSQDPKFQQSNPQLAASLPGMPTDIATKVLGKMLDKTYSGKTEPYQRDGKSYFSVYDTNNPADSQEIPIKGTPQQQIIKEIPSAPKAKTVEDYVKDYRETAKPPDPGKYTLSSSLKRDEMNWMKGMARNLVSKGYPKEQAEAAAVAALGYPKATKLFPDAAPAAPTGAGGTPAAGPSPTPAPSPTPTPTLSPADRKLLEAGLPKTPPPKKFWGQDRIMNGVKVHIDEKGQVTALGKA